MAVKVKYMVIRKGKEVMSSVSQKEANAYDKMLDISDELMVFLEEKVKEVFGDVDEKKLEEFCVHLASNKELVGKLLRGQKYTSLEEEKSQKKSKSKKDEK